MTNLIRNNAKRYNVPEKIHLIGRGGVQHTYLELVGIVESVRDPVEFNYSVVSKFPYSVYGEGTSVIIDPSDGPVLYEGLPFEEHGLYIDSIQDKPVLITMLKS